jgi:hypothetical protein
MEGLLSIVYALICYGLFAAVFLFVAVSEIFLDSGVETMYKKFTSSLNFSYVLC